MVSSAYPAPIKVGCVQARWAHLNREASLLTRVQALMLDGHHLEADVPILLVHGGRDQYVSPQHHEEIAAAALASGVQVTVLEVPSMGHSMLPDLRRDGSEVREAVLNFLRTAPLDN